jgi:hypothetical protein
LRLRSGESFTLAGELDVGTGSLFENECYR